MFTHLHNHTEYSTFDGCSKVESIFAKARQEGMDAVAITDHHNVFGWFPAINAARKYKVDALFGAELNVGKHHITALAIDEYGIENIIRLNNLGYEKSGKPQVSEKQLFEHAKGIHILAGCSKGKIPTLIACGCYEEAKWAIEKYKSAFENRFSIEVQNFRQDTYRKTLESTLYIAKEMGVSVVPTNDCHYMTREDFGHHYHLMATQTNGKIKAVNHENYFKGIAEMEAIFPATALERTNQIRRTCRADFESFIHEQHGEIEIPLSMFYRYDDAEALKRVLSSKQKFKLGSFMYAKMQREDLTLEDLCKTGDLHEEIEAAYGLRGRLRLIERDPYNYIKTTALMPIYRRNKDCGYSAQMDYFTAQALGFEIRSRKTERTMQTV
jgi:DNA polymerase III alpha subunit